MVSLYSETVKKVNNTLYFCRLNCTIYSLTIEKFKKW